MQIEIHRDGLCLRGLLEVPDKETYDMAILLHGFTGNCGYLPEKILHQLAQRLLAQGIGVIRMDFNGHGNSDGGFCNMSVLSEILDAKAILDYVRRMDGVQKIYLAGHSQGGVVAGMLAGYYPEYINGLLLMAAASTLKTDAQKGTIMGTNYNPHHVPDMVQFGMNALDGFYFRSAQSLPIYEVSSLYHGPVCIIQGDADTVVDKAAAEEYRQIYPNCEFHLVKGANHNFDGPQREELLETGVRFISVDADQMH